jgi:hypothetical protein
VVTDGYFIDIRANFHNNACIFMTRDNRKCMSTAE